MSRLYNNYQDPYQSGGAEYLNDRPADYATPGESSGTPINEHDYGHYNTYSRTSMEKSVDPDGVNALGEIGGERRQQPGRARIGEGGAPMSSFEVFGPPPRSTGVLRIWRKDERGKQWTRGGGVRSGCRMITCCLLITIAMVIAIILSILLYVRPPSVIIDSNNFETSSQGITFDNGKMTGRISVGVSVTNPNWFDADFKKIQAIVKADGYDLQLGEGVTTNAKFKRYALSQFTFPVNMNVTFSGNANDDNVNGVLNLLKQRCVSTSSNLPIKISIGLWLRILSLTIKIPDISISPSIPCPDGIQQLTTS